MLKLVCPKICWAGLRLCIEAMREVIYLLSHLKGNIHVHVGIEIMYTFKVS